MFFINENKIRARGRDGPQRSLTASRNDSDSRRRKEKENVIFGSVLLDVALACFREAQV